MKKFLLLTCIASIFALVQIKKKRINEEIVDGPLDLPRRIITFR